MTVDATREGRLEEIEALYRLRLAEFVRVATAISGSADRGADAVQDGFAQAVRNTGQFRGDGPIDAWVWRIVVNAARREARRRPVGEIPSDLAAANGHHDDASHIRDAIAGLADRQRQVLFLRYYADLDLAAIAEALSIRRGTVAATLHQAHAALRSRLEIPS